MFGYCVCLLLYWWVPAVPGIRRWSTYSYAIYLYHVLGTSATRRTLAAMRFETTPVAFVACLATGLLLPMLIHQMAMRWASTNLLILGLTTYSSVPDSGAHKADRGSTSRAPRSHRRSIGSPATWSMTRWSTAQSYRIQLLELASERLYSFNFALVSESTQLP